MAKLTQEELDRIKDRTFNLAVKGIRFTVDDIDLVTINGMPLKELLEAAEAHKGKQPKVLDADGIEIKPGDELYYSDRTYFSGKFAGTIASVHTDKCPQPTKDANKPWVRYEEGGWDLAERLTHQKPETLQDVIADMDKYYIEYWGCSDCDCKECPAKINGKTPDDYYDTDGNCIFAMYEDIQCRIKAIAKRMGGDEGNKADSPVEIPERKTCPHCGRSHVITTKVITIGEGRYRESETDLCLTCGRDLVEGNPK